MSSAEELKFLNKWAKGQPVYIATQDDVDIVGANDFKDLIASNPTIHDLISSVPVNMRHNKKEELKELFSSLAKFSILELQSQSAKMTSDVVDEIQELRNCRFCNNNGLSICLDCQTNMKQEVEARVRDKLNEKIDLFFDKRIDLIYDSIYGEGSEDPMPFDEIKKHFKDFLVSEKAGNKIDSNVEGKRLNSNPASTGTKKNGDV